MSAEEPLVAGADEPVTGTGFVPVFGPKAEPIPDMGRPQRRQVKKRSVASLARQERQAQAVRLRVAGLDYHEIAAELGCSRDTAMDDVDRWINEQKPSEEQTESLRQLMMQRLESLHATWWKAAHGAYEDRWGRQIPNDKAAELLLKIQDRQARLMGLDLQPNTQTITITAEAVAQFLGWDQVEVVATLPALEEGSSPG